MATFIIYFSGLICHVADKQVDAREKTHAVVVDAPHHAARICLKAIINGNPTDVRVPLESDDRISFGSELAAGTARTDNTFRDSVPSLGFITDDGELDFQIKNQQKDNDARAYVQFPKGTLSVYAMYPYKGIYARTPGGGVGAAKCIAKMTQFTATTNYPTITVTIARASGNLTYTVPADSTACILNTTDMTGHHLDFHRRLTNSPTVMRVQSTKQPCTPTELAVCPCGIQPDSADPECSNSQWP